MILTLRTVSGARRTAPARKVLPAVFLATALQLAVGCSLPEDTAALVNDRPIPAEKLERAYQGFHDRYGELAPPDRAERERTRRVLIDQLIDTELMMQEAERRGLLPSEKEIGARAGELQGSLSGKEFESILADTGLERDEWLEEIARELAIETLQFQVTEDFGPISDSEVDSYLSLHREGSQLPEEIRISQILVRTSEEAVAALKRITGGEAFADTARDVSLSPDAEVGGDIGFFSRGQLPQEIDTAVFSLTPGKVSSVVETTYGFHLFLVTDRREARVESDEEVRRRARRLLTAERDEKGFGRWLAGLRAGAEIRYNEKILAR